MNERERLISDEMVDAARQIILDDVDVWLSGETLRSALFAAFSERFASLIEAARKVEKRTGKRFTFDPDKLAEFLSHPPAQAGAVTDDAVIRAGDVLMQHGLNAPEQVVYQAARAALTAALGAQTPPEGAVTDLAELIQLRILALSDGKPSAKKDFAIEELRFILKRAAAPTPPDQSEGADRE